jgi:hypothetical protein
MHTLRPPRLPLWKLPVPLADSIFLLQISTSSFTYNPPDNSLLINPSPQTLPLSWVSLWLSASCGILSVVIKTLPIKIRQQFLELGDTSNQLFTLMIIWTHYFYLGIVLRSASILYSTHYPRSTLGDTINILLNSFGQKPPPLHKVIELTARQRL